MWIETRKRKNPDRRITGLVVTEYDRRNGYWHGCRLLCMVHHCPNRYWARKAVAYWLKGKVAVHGWTDEFFAELGPKSMPKNEVIHFDEIAFGIGYHKYVRVNNGQQTPTDDN